MYYVSCNYEPEALQILSKEEFEFIKYENIGLNLNSKELIFKENAPITYVIFLFKGIIKLVKKNIHNKAEILKLIKGLCYVGLSLLYGIKQYPYSAFAASEVKLCLIKRERFQSNNFYSPLNKTELASLLSIFRKSVFRVLTEFKNNGLIDHDGNHFTIIKRHILKKISRNG